MVYLCAEKFNMMDKRKKYLDLALSVDDPVVTAGKGQNKIPEPEKEPLWKRYLEKFKDPLIIVLLGALFLSCFVSGYEIYQTGNWRLLFEPIGVLFAILLSTGVGFIFEVKADQEFDVLNQVKHTQPVKVLRRPWKDAHPQMYSIPKMDVVVGDVVRIESGDQLPADGLLLVSNSLRVDESIFTGEPYQDKFTPDSKDYHKYSESAYPADRVLRGSTVIDGNGIYVVDKTAVESEEGRGVALTREGSNVKTPLNRQLDQLGRWISYASFGIAALIVIGRLVYYFGFTNLADKMEPIAIFGFFLQSLMIAVTLIVVAVPEGLPMSVTVSLALSMRKMLKENNLVRKLHACETMGATTVICTDKTGTLTQNRMSVVEHRFLGDYDKEELALGISVNSTAALTVEKKPIGNPTEGALLMWLNSMGYDYQQLRESAKVVKQQPFSTQTKYMLTVVEKDDHTLVKYIKGAPELLLNSCEEIAGGVSKQEVEETLASYQNHAMRTLGFAVQYGEGPTTFIGVVGIADPIRPDVAAAIHQCKDVAGVKVIIVTGDTVGTANEIGREIGLLQPGELDKTIQGPDFANRSNGELKEMLKHYQIRIIARARPEDKARLVTLLQQNHEVVAVTGDGTNDAPALAKAHVGLSMGSGTSRAKEASDITIIDDSFSSINKAILWGRSIYWNIRRFILFQMTINVCACLVVLLGAIMGIDSPLNVTQMLWINLIMDTFAAGALSSLPADQRVLHDKPRSPRAHIVNFQMGWRIAAWGLGFFVVLVGLWQLLYHTELHHVKDLFNLDALAIYFKGFFKGHEGKVALSAYEHGIFFTFFVILQFWNLFNARYFRTDGSVLQEVYHFFTDRERFRQTYSPGFVIVAFIILAGQFIIINLLPDFFEVDRMSMEDWGVILLITSPVFVVPELIRSARILLKRR